MPSPAARPAPRGLISPARAVMMVYTAGMFMSIMDTQIVNVALATISRQFHASASGVQWVVTGYLLSLAIWIPVSGWLSDRFGTRAVYLYAIGIFTAASALCAASTSLPELVAMRVLQGVGGGLLMPVGQAMLYASFPPERRVLVARSVTRVTMLAPATAPIVGGVLVSALSWHWIFLVNLPVGAVLLLFAWRFLPTFRRDRPPGFDVVGFVAGGGSLALLLYAVSGLGQGNGVPAATWACGAVSLAGLAFFYRYERRRPVPMINLRLLDDRLFRRCCAMVSLSSVVFVSSLVFTALYLQQSRGYSPLLSGATTFTEAIGVICGVQVVGRLYPRTGPRRLLVAGFAGMGAVTLLLARIGATTSDWTVRSLIFALGLAVSFVLLPNQAAAYSRIPVPETSQASAIYITAQRSASALGVAVLAAVLELAGGSGLRIPAAAFHPVYYAVAGCAAVAALVAVRVRDSDAAASMRAPGAGGPPAATRAADAVPGDAPDAEGA